MAHPVKRLYHNLVSNPEHASVEVTSSLRNNLGSGPVLIEHLRVGTLISTFLISTPTLRCLMSTGPDRKL